MSKLILLCAAFLAVILAVNADSDERQLSSESNPNQNQMLLPLQNVAKVAVGPNVQDIPFEQLVRKGRGGGGRGGGKGSGKSSSSKGIGKGVSGLSSSSSKGRGNSGLSSSSSIGRGGRTGIGRNGGRFGFGTNFGRFGGFLSNPFG